MKNTSAETSLSIYVDCPYCDNYQNATEDLREHLNSEFKAEDIEVEVLCDYHLCAKTFMITEITY